MNEDWEEWQDKVAFDINSDEEDEQLVSEYKEYSYGDD